MIVTVTANPSLDRTVELDAPLSAGGVHRILAEETQPGGKGVNVALGIHRAGVEVRALLPAAPGDPLLRLLEESGLPYLASPTEAAVRTNLTVLSPVHNGGSTVITTKINEPGHPLGRDGGQALHDLLLGSVTVGDVVMLSGSLSPGLPVDSYVQTTATLQELGVRVGVDTSGGPLLAIANALPGTAPDLLKPNAEELGLIVGVSGEELEERAEAGDLAPVRDAALSLHAQGVGAVLVTLGGAGGVLATEGAAWHAPSRRVPVVSTVGAGDSASAGYLIGLDLGEDPAHRLARALAYGSAAVALPGTTIPRPEQVHIEPQLVQRI